ncbi:hypothetical protein R1flu_000947 [Riccia fluitans]|uniref:Uncharacterized protein n=1 Tax=Riccia fluitans TaxID=41844 RepID=A0ABD1Y1X8_9MARC
MTTCSYKDLRIKMKEVKIPHLMKENKTKLEAWEAWTSKVWREVYNLPKTISGGYIMKGKVQFMELQLLKLVRETSG